VPTQTQLAPLTTLRLGGPAGRFVACSIQDELVDVVRSADASGERLVVEAGEPWDPLVALTVEEGLLGFECLSGIPGSTGATPIQNVGAYGQEVSATVRSVRALDRRTGGIEELPPERCGLGYRSSIFNAAIATWCCR
jgi:UDP-N-acetylmuramate dehydrogenase